MTQLFLTTVAGVGPFCVEFGDDGEIITTRSEERQRLIAAAPRMADALEATLLFFGGAEWDDTRRLRWLELTGHTDATTRVLCDVIRRALGQAKGQV